jgi:hypothetical protein
VSPSTNRAIVYEVCAPQKYGQPREYLMIPQNVLVDVELLRTISIEENIPLGLPLSDISSTAETAIFFAASKAPAGRNAVVIKATSHDQVHVCGDYQARRDTILSRTILCVLSLADKQPTSPFSKTVWPLSYLPVESDVHSFTPTESVLHTAPSYRLTSTRPWLWSARDRTMVPN